MKTLFCIAAVCVVSTLGFGGDEDNGTYPIVPACPPTCVKQPPMKVKVKKETKKHLGR